MAIRKWLELESEIRNDFSADLEATAKSIGLKIDPFLKRCLVEGFLSVKESGEFKHDPSYTIRVFKRGN